MLTRVLLVILSASLIPAPGAAPAPGGTLETANYRIHKESPDIDDDELGPISAHCEAVYRRILAFLDDPAPSPKIDYHIYPSFETKGLATGDTRLAHADVARHEIHLVINDWIRGDDATMDALVLVRHHLGMPVTRALEVGFALYFSERWREKGYEYWAARLYRSGNALGLGELLDNDTLGRQSYLVVAPLAGTFVAYAVKVFGKAALLDHYATWRPADPAEIANLERGWHSYLEALTERYQAQIEADRRTFPRVSGFQKGFCHAHEGYQIFNGYLSRKSDEALAKLARIGTNAISITPFSYMRNPHRPAPLPFSQGPGAENDECVIHASNTARRLGMAVMLKPHIWLGRSWPGDIEMESEADWERFFDYYGRWIRHYALLAEMYRIEMLCIGVEMSKTTVSHEDEWKGIIARLRGLYSGALIYAANWGEEFESLTFWDDLDYIGINCYYPLSDRDTADLDELKRGAQFIFAKMQAVHERYKRPVVITEIGYASTNAPWRRPHQAARRASVSLDDQALCYRAVFEALSGSSWCEGIYWWKWPSFLEYGGRRNSDFTPNGKPAEKIIEEWYSRLPGRKPAGFFSK